MSSKALLVAGREFTENIRTKTFWIGVLVFPVILVLMIVVPRLLEKAKDVRRYAVIDQSGWLLDAIQERAQYDDALRMLKFLRKKAEAGQTHKLPEALRAQAEALRGQSDEALVAQAKLSTLLGKAFFSPQTGEEAPEEAASAELTEEQKAQTREFLGWMLSLSASEARELGGNIRRADYELVEVPEDAADPEAWLRERLAEGPKSLFAYFVIAPDPLDPDAQNKYVSNNQTDEDLKDWFTRLATDEVVARRFQKEAIDQNVARRIQSPVVFSSKQVDEKTGEESEVSTEDVIKQWAPVAFVYLLWISVFTIVQMLLTNTVEEKSNRIIEVLLSSVSPLQLMSGKILGIAFTGLTLIGSWVVFFVATLKLLPRFMETQGMPDFTVLITDPVYLGSFVLYFLAGYLLYAAILVGLGSVCNSLKEAQNLMTPITVVLILPLAAMVPVGKDPNGTLAVILSFIPPFTPFVMMNRAAGPPAAWEYAATGVLLVGSIMLAFWAAAKVFRIGILMTGKPPKPSEILRWLRAPVGTVPVVKE